MSTTCPLSRGFALLALFCHFSLPSFGSVEVPTSTPQAVGMWTSVEIPSFDSLKWERRAQAQCGTVEFKRIVHGSGLFLALGSDGHSLYRSGDGVSWSCVRTVETFANLACVDGVFFGLGRMGDKSAIYRSMDGATWSCVHKGGRAGRLTSLAASVGRLVAVGDSGEALSSQDGLSWRPCEGTDPEVYFESVAHGTNGWVAVGVGGRVSTSADGVTWVNRIIEDARNLYSYPNSVVQYKGRWFYAAGYRVYVSTNLIDWTLAGQWSSDVNALHVTEGGLLIALLRDGLMCVSETGDAWSSRGLYHVTESSPRGTAIAEGNGTLVVVGSPGLILQAGVPVRSAPSLAAPEALEGVQPGQALSISAKASGWSRVELWVDGTPVAEMTGDNPDFSWTPAKAAGHNLVVRGVDSQGRGMFSESHRLVVGPGSGTWVRRPNPSPIADGLRSVAFGAGRFVVAGDTAQLTSTDGESWFKLEKVPAKFSAKVAHYGRGRFLLAGRVVGADGSLALCISSSSDGLDFSQSTPMEGLGDFVAMASGPAGFVAAGSQGLLAYSPDGLSWTRVQLDFVSCQSLVQANGVFVMTTFNGIFRSTDGRTWEHVIDVSSCFAARAFDRWYFMNGGGVSASEDLRSFWDLLYPSDAPISAVGVSASWPLIAVVGPKSVAVSGDGRSWDILVVDASVGSGQLLSVCEGNGCLVAVGETGAIYQSVGARLRTPSLLTTAASLDAVSLDTSVPLATRAKGYRSVQLLVEGALVAEKTGDDPVFEWVPSTVGAHVLQLRGVGASGEQVDSPQVRAYVYPNLNWTWQAPTAHGAGTFNVVTVINGVWRAFGEGGLSLRSEDGVVWRADRFPSGATITAHATDGRLHVVATKNYDYSVSEYRSVLWTSLDGEHWTQVDGLARQVGDVEALAWGNGRWLAGGGMGLLLSSTDGVHWTTHNVGEPWITGLAYHGGRWVGTCLSGKIITSLDGVSWESLETGSTLPLVSVCHGGAGWIAVGPGAPLFKSEDGIKWTTTGAGTGLGYQSVTWTGDRYLATAGGGRLRSSLDGDNWTYSVLQANLPLYSAFEYNGLVVAVGGGAQIMAGRSLGAMAWLEQRPRPDIKAALWTGERLLSAGAHTDASWSELPGEPVQSSTKNQGFVYGKLDRWVFDSANAIAVNSWGQAVVAGNRGLVLRSGDGLSWNVVDCPDAPTFRGCAINDQGVSVMAGDGGALRSLSLDGSWRTHTEAGGQTLRAVRCIKGVIFVCGDGGTLLRSDDGLAWRRLETGTTVSLRGIAWSKGHGYVVVGWGGVTLRSSDGATWTSSVDASRPSLTRFEMVGDLMVGIGWRQVWLSVDGSKWTRSPLPPLDWEALASDGENMWICGPGGALMKAEQARARLEPPALLSQTRAQTCQRGETLTLSVSAQGENLSYQWYKDGVKLDGLSTSSTYEIWKLDEDTAGTYTCLVSNAAGTVVSTEIPVVCTASRIVNMSIRGFQKYRNPLIVGFVTAGTGQTPLLLRASGPSLQGFGVEGTMPNPRLALHDDIARGGGVLASNDDWGKGADTPGLVQSERVFAQLGAFPFASRNSKDASLQGEVSGLRTAYVEDEKDAEGVTLVELYDMGGSHDSRLVNVSARNHVGQGDRILVMGFAVKGNTVKRLLVRGVAPTLAKAPFNLPDMLADPEIRVFSITGGVATQIGANDNWGTEDPAKLRVAFAATGAFDLADAGSKDAALLLECQPGLYTLELRSTTGEPGQAMMELYEMP